MIISTLFWCGKFVDVSNGQTISYIVSKHSLISGSDPEDTRPSKSRSFGGLVSSGFSASGERAS